MKPGAEGRGKQSSAAIFICPNRGAMSLWTSKNADETARRPPHHCAPVSHKLGGIAASLRSLLIGSSAVPSILRSFLLSSRKVNLMHVLKDSICPIVSFYHLHSQGDPSALGCAGANLPCAHMQREAPGGLHQRPSSPLQATATERDLLQLPYAHLSLLHNFLEKHTSFQNKRRPTKLKKT